MNLFLYLCLIFLGGAIPLVEAMIVIPLGIIAGVPTIPTIILGFLGNLIGVVLVILFVDKVKVLLRKRKKQKQRAVSEVSYGEEQDTQKSEDENLYEPTETQKNKRMEKAKKLWDKYGVPGLAFFGTALLSSHLTAIMACSFGGNRAYVTIWMTISLAIWSLTTGVAVHFGMDAFFR